MEVTEYAKDLYILDDGQVREFLIIGRNEAILIRYSEEIINCW